MGNFTIDPNMGFPNPTPGVDPGPDYANNLQASLTVIGYHDHSPGNGVFVTPNGLNINADLPMNGNNLTLIKTVRLNNLSGTITGAAPNLTCIYAANGELYYNDGAGNIVKITAAGSVNATSSGISSGTATASFSGGVLVVDSNVNTPADIKVGNVLIGDDTTDGFFVTLQPPTLSGSYALTLPAVPASARVLVEDNAGNITPSGVAGTGTTQADVLPSFGLIPTGAVVEFYGTSAPVGYLMCDGTSYLRSTYPALFTAIGTACGTADGTHFNVPDKRGYFPRGVSGASGNDPDASSRTAQHTGGNAGNNVGSVQGHQFQDHDHTMSAQINTSGAGANIAQRDAGNTSTTTLGVISGNHGSETRPLNIYCNYIIKT